MTTTATQLPPFAVEQANAWARHQSQLDSMLAALPWDRQTRADLKFVACSHPLWRGRVLMLHGPADDEPMEQFGLVTKLGSFFCQSPVMAALVLGNDRKARRLPIKNLLLRDVRRLRQWMAAHAPAEARWAPCCDANSVRLARLLGLRIAVLGGVQFACWGGLE